MIKKLWQWLRSLFTKKQQPKTAAPYQIKKLTRKKTGKHPLHQYHFGTFSPIKPLRW